MRICLILFLLALLPSTAAGSTLFDREEQTLWTLINEYRQVNGLPTVSINEQLMEAADWKSDDMAANDYLGHTDSLGRSSNQRMVAFGFDPAAATGENLVGLDEGTAQAAFDRMKASPEHRAVMLGEYVWVGVARIFSANSAHRLYWTVDFGGPSLDPPCICPPPEPCPSNFPSAFPATGRE